MATKTYSLEEVKKHTTDKDCWLVIHGKVYDVTEFLEEHPGGFDIMLTSTGKDATTDFDEIGHSKSAQKMLEKYLIGTFEGGDSIPPPPPKAAPAATVQQKSAATRTFHVILPLLLLAVALALNFYLNGQAAAKKKQ